MMAKRRERNEEENPTRSEVPSPETQTEVLTRVLESFEKYVKLSSINCPPPSPFDITEDIEIEDFFDDFEEFCTVKYRHSEKNWARILGNYLKGKVKEAFNTLHGATKAYVEIKEELLNFVEKSRKKTRKEKAEEFFILRRKEGEKLDMYDLRLNTAATKCFKDPKGEEVLKYKSIKIMEEIDEEIKEEIERVKERDRNKKKKEKK